MARLSRSVFTGERGPERITALPAARPVDVTAVSVVHHDNHGLALSRGDLPVQDVGHVALLVPPTLILAHAVLQVEHGVFLLRLRLILGRRVDVATAHPPFHRRIVLAFAHLAVGYVLVVGVIGRFLGRLGNLDAAAHPPATVEAIRTGVGHLHAIHQEEVIMEAHHQRVGGHRPHPLRIFRHGILLPANVGHNRLCLGRPQAEHRPSLGVYLWILGHRHIVNGALRFLPMGFRNALHRHSGQQGTRPYRFPFKIHRSHNILF